MNDDFDLKAGALLTVGIVIGALIVAMAMGGLAGRRIADTCGAVLTEEHSAKLWTECQSDQSAFMKEHVTLKEDSE